MTDSDQGCTETGPVSNTVCDAALLERVQARGPDAAAACALLLDRHRRSLYWRCMQRLGNSHDADDALQETLLRALHGLHGFEGRSGVRTWLFAIADNECCSFVRRKSRHQQVEHLRSLIQIHEEHQRRWASIDGEQVRMVNKTLKQLPPKAREVLGLRFFRDASFDEIARTLGISLSAAKMRLYRALDLFEANFPDAQGSDVGLSKLMAA